MGLDFIQDLQVLLVKIVWSLTLGPASYGCHRRGGRREAFRYVAATHEGICRSEQFFEITRHGEVQTDLIELREKSTVQKLYLHKQHEKTTSKENTLSHFTKVPKELEK